jgi:hypothetical protein
MIYRPYAVMLMSKQVCSGYLMKNGLTQTTVSVPIFVSKTNSTHYDIWRSGENLIGCDYKAGNKNI